MKARIWCCVQGVIKKFAQTVNKLWLENREHKNMGLNSHFINSDVNCFVIFNFLVCKIWIIKQTTLRNVVEIK